MDAHGHWADEIRLHAFGGRGLQRLPLPKSKDLSKLTPFAQAILDARANHPDASLADLYDPDVMPADLRRAHIANDRAVDKLYSRAGFKSERDRVEHLFAMYENQVAPMLAKPKKRRR